MVPEADIFFDPTKSIRLYLQQADILFRQIKIYHAEGSLRKAYRLCQEFQTLVKEKLPTHPEYNSPKSARRLKHVSEADVEVLNILELLRPVLRSKGLERDGSTTGKSGLNSPDEESGDDESSSPPTEVDYAQRASAGRPFGQSLDQDLAKGGETVRIPGETIKERQGRLLTTLKQWSEPESRSESTPTADVGGVTADTRSTAFPGTRKPSIPSGRARPTASDLRPNSKSPSRKAEHGARPHPPPKPTTPKPKLPPMPSNPEDPERGGHPVPTRQTLQSTSIDDILEKTRLLSVSNFGRAQTGVKRRIESAGERHQGPKDGRRISLPRERALEVGLEGPTCIQQNGHFVSRSTVGDVPKAVSSEVAEAAAVTPNVVQDGSPVVSGTIEDDLSEFHARFPELPEFETSHDQNKDSPTGSTVVSKGSDGLPQPYPVVEFDEPRPEPPAEDREPSRSRYLSDELNAPGTCLPPAVAAHQKSQSSGSQSPRRREASAPQRHPTRAARSPHGFEVRTDVSRDPGQQRPLQNALGSRARAEQVDDVEPVAGPNRSSTSHLEVVKPTAIEEPIDEDVETIEAGYLRTGPLPFEDFEFLNHFERLRTSVLFADSGHANHPKYMEVNAEHEIRHRPPIGAQGYSQAPMGTPWMAQAYSMQQRAPVAEFPQHAKHQQLQNPPHDAQGSHTLHRRSAQKNVSPKNHERSNKLGDTWRDMQSMQPDASYVAQTKRTGHHAGLTGSNHSPSTPVRTSQSRRARLESGERLRWLVLPTSIVPHFLEVAETNTAKNVETCGVLCGTLTKNVLRVTTLIIPAQHGTSDTCNTENEEDLFEYQTREGLLTLGWIHTHPSQTCFMSSVDLHTHCSYQIMLKEAIAVVCAPKFNPNVGVFRMTDPPGLQVVTNCSQSGTFHPHPDTERLYRNISTKAHVVPDFESTVKVVDLRR